MILFMDQSPSIIGLGGPFDHCIRNRLRRNKKNSIHPQDKLLSACLRSYHKGEHQQ